MRRGLRPTNTARSAHRRISASIGVGVLAAALALTGCTNDPEPEVTETATEVVEEVTTTPAVTEVPTPTDADIAALNAVEVSGAAGSEPTVTFAQPFTVSAPVTRLVSDGDGAALEDGQQVTLQGLSYTGEGELLYSTWAANEPQTFMLGSQLFAPLTPVLTGAHVGARVLLANPTLVEGQPTTVLSLFEVIDAKTIPLRAEGEAVTPEPGLPTVTLAADGQPSIEFPADYQAPTELVVQTLIKGDGPVVTADQYLTVQYTGWLLDGTEFDSSWSRGEPSGFPLTGVIPGWTQGLAGQTVGSQVLLVIPPDLAYGDQAVGTIPAGSTLTFVVDILSAE